MDTGVVLMCRWLYVPETLFWMIALQRTLAVELVCLAAGCISSIERKIPKR